MAAQIKKSIANGIRWLAVAAVFMSFSAPTLADQYDDQIAAINAQIKQQQAEIARLRGEQNNLQNQIATLNAQIANTNSQLALSQAEYAKLSEELAAAEAKLAQKKEVLGESIRAIYLETNLTPIEMLASSNNFSDFVDRAQYLQSLKTSVEEAIAAVTVIKAQLEVQKAEQAKLISQQQGLRNTLSAQRGDVNRLLAQTQGQESQYQKLVADNQSKLQQVIAARAAAIRSGELKVSGGGCGPYPDQWCNANYYNPPDTIYGLPARQCTSYAAWRRHDIGRPLGRNYGNARDWPVNSMIPSSGDVIVWGPWANPYIEQWGHVAIVESVSGNTVTLSQYNFDYGSGPGRYSIMTVQIGSGILANIKGYYH